MKRLIYISIFLFGFTSLNAQYKYKVEYGLLSDIVTPPYTRSVSVHFDINLFAETQILVYIISDGNYYEGDAFFELPDMYSQVDIYYRDSFVALTLRSYDIGCYDDIDIEPDMFPEADADYFRVYRVGFAEQNDYDPMDNLLDDCESTALKVTKDLSCQGVGINYGVQYQVGSNTSTWDVLIPYGNHPNEFNISRGNFSGLDLNENLRLRMQYDNPTSGTPIYSEILTYSYEQCSPKVVSVISMPETCNENNDGGFIINFDRPLNPGERLDFINLISSGPDAIFGMDPMDPFGLDDIIFQTISSINDPAFIVLGYTGTSTSWPLDVTPGDYRIEYQSIGTSSVERSEPFIITSPDPILFTAEGSDINCFGENNGSISIYNVSGGVGIYEFSLDNGVNWAPFDNANSHDEMNLGLGNYQVKVRDANQCVAQL